MTSAAIITDFDGKGEVKNDESFKNLFRFFGYSLLLIILYVFRVRVL